MSEKPDAVAGRAPRAFAWLRQTLPTVFVLAGLGALAWCGHHTGWSIPTFASLTGSEAKEKDDWCAEHGVPESICVECNPDLMPRGKDHGWCKTHGVHNCPLEHPDVAQLAYLPQITASDLERARRALDLSPRPLNSSKCKLYQRRIQFASKDAVEKAGIDVKSVDEAPIIEAVAANGEVGYDQSRVARLSVRVPGTVWWVPKRVGEEVKRGEVLAIVDAAEVGRAKAEFLQAVVQLDVRRKSLASTNKVSDIIPEGQLQATEAALREAEIRVQTAEQALVNLGLPLRADDVKTLNSAEMRRRVQFLGLPESVVKSVDPTTTSANLIPVVSPLDGVVVARDAMSGEIVDSTKVLFTVADTRQMRLTLNLSQEDAQRVTRGHTARFRSPGGDEVSGVVNWISTSVDEKTRTVKVTASLPNADGRLRANTFGQGRIILREEKSAVVVPSEAVHWEGDCFVVFVRDKNFLAENAPKVFHVRTVRPGVNDGQNTEIIAGVLPGELVVTKGSGTLRSELLKANLGEG
jgi:cobalt-zinc-cadmium efflux system membrane fusion protein